MGVGLLLVVVVGPYVLHFRGRVVVCDLGIICRGDIIGTDCAGDFLFGGDGLPGEAGGMVRVGRVVVFLGWLVVI